MKFTAKITGAHELGARAVGLGREMAKPGPLYPLEQGLLAGGRVIAEEAKRLAPRRTGRGAESIAARVVESRDGRVIVNIGPGHKEFYLMFHELGTSRHKATPFLRPALDSREKDAVEVARQVWRGAVIDYARQRAGGTA